MISRSLFTACSRLGLMSRRVMRMPSSSSVIAMPRAMSSGHQEIDIMDKKHYPPGRHPATWDEYPVPHGSWLEYNEKLQRKYNYQLAFGLSFFFLTLWVLMVTPEVDFVQPPKSLGVNPPKFSAYAPGQSPRDKKNN